MTCTAPRFWSVLLTGFCRNPAVARRDGLPVCARHAGEQPDVQSPMSNYRDLSAEVAESAGSSTVGDSNV